MPIAIVGTGRSGTSMVARMLNLCGLHLGDYEDIYNADETNEKGSWENAQLNEVNNALLEHLGGTCMDPPDLQQGWQNAPDLQPIYAHAVDLITKIFGDSTSWGWKLPRASVTIPFWRRVCPDIKFVVCVRNPVDFASSLRRYYGYDAGLAYDLWQLYNCAVLRDTNPSERILTFYEDYFPEYGDALAPVVEFCGLSMPLAGSPDELAMRDFHSPGLKHHNSSPLDVMCNKDVPYLVNELYLQLLSGPRDASDLPLMKRAASFMPMLHQSAAAKLTVQDQGLTRHRLANTEKALAELAEQHALLNNHSRQMEQILSSRTHRIASQVCSLLVRFSQGNLKREAAETEHSTGYKAAQLAERQPKVV